MLQMENLFESIVISCILFNPFAKNSSCVVIVSIFSSNKILSLDTARDARLFYSAFSLVDCLLIPIKDNQSVKPKMFQSMRNTGFAHIIC